MWGQGGMLKNLDSHLAIFDLYHASLNHVGFHSGNKLMEIKINTRFRAFSATKHTRTK